MNTDMAYELKRDEQNRSIRPHLYLFSLLRVFLPQLTQLGSLITPLSLITRATNSHGSVTSVSVPSDPLGYLHCHLSSRCSHFNTTREWNRWGCYYHPIWDLCGSSVSDYCLSVRLVTISSRSLNQEKKKATNARSRSFVPVFSSRWQGWLLLVSHWHWLLTLYFIATKLAWFAPAQHHLADRGMIRDFVGRTDSVWKSRIEFQSRWQAVSLLIRCQSLQTHARVSGKRKVLAGHVARSTRASVSTPTPYLPWSLSKRHLRKHPPSCRWITWLISIATTSTIPQTVLALYRRWCYFESFGETT